MISVFQPDLSSIERKILLECFDSGWISSQGEYVSQFEQHMLNGVQDRYPVATCNGTAALHLALMALGVSFGDEVIVPDITFGATLNAIYHVGAIPVIADINIYDWNLCRDSLEQCFTDKTRAVIPVALFGNPTGIDFIAKWALDKEIFCVVDAAEAVGAKLNNIDIGAYGDAVTYSYFANKTLTTGEGGGIVFKNKNDYEKALLLRDHGMSRDKRYHHQVVGYNYRLTSLQAAIGCIQYTRLDDFLLIRRKLNDQYREMLGEVVDFQFVSSDASSSYWAIAIKLRDLDAKKIHSYLAANDVETRLCFENMHLQPAFESAQKPVSLKNAICLQSTILMLPTHCKVSSSDVVFICNAIKKALHA